MLPLLPQSHSYITLVTSSILLYMGILSLSPSASNLSTTLKLVSPSVSFLDSEDYSQILDIPFSFDIETRSRPFQSEKTYEPAAFPG